MIQSVFEALEERHFVGEVEEDMRNVAVWARIAGHCLHPRSGANGRYQNVRTFVMLRETFDKQKMLSENELISANVQRT